MHARLDFAEDDAIVVGSTYTQFEGEVVPAASRDRAREDAVFLLGNLFPSSSSSGRTVLAVGQVQSGKTMSYEGLICLARDNGISLVVVVSGISNPLLSQGAGRLDEDLERAAPGAWLYRTNPSPDDDADVHAFRGVVGDWSDTQVPASMRRTVIVTVLKHHGRLRALRQLLHKVGWGDGPVLIIDDEADQASLNARIRQDDESTTYSRLVELRESFSRFGYVQYTATPQAPLLISIADVLSPERVRVLVPGDGYTGGRAFFVDGELTLVKTIPDADLVALDENAIEPPLSLVESLRVYFLGLAFSFASEVSAPRSMLIHPSQGTDPHASFYTWTQAYLESVMDRTMRARDDAELRQELMVEFESAWRDIRSTVPDFPDLESLLSAMPTVLRRTLVLKMNASSGSTPKVPWRDFYGFILVGGQALDRGFTVKGLTVTYMPRGVGVGNADTVQQRARFFGYKRDYLGLCRVYLEASTRSAFEAYVRHEEDVRVRLEEVSGREMDLREWRRLFVLDPSLQPTRWSVRERGGIRGGSGEEWLFLRHAISNLQELFGKCEVIDDAIRWNGLSREPYLEIGASSPSEVINFLEEIQTDDEWDSLQITGMLSQLQSAIAVDTAERVKILLMRPGRPSRRSVDSSGRIRQLFQGRGSSGISSSRYPGDRAVHDDDLTLQIHMIASDSLGDSSGVGMVPALYVPERLATPWFLQETS
jgi:hypothetical protein